MIKLSMKAVCVLLIITTIGCKQEVKESTAPAPVTTPPVVEELRSPTDYSLPEWAKDANLYEVNIRQFTEEGTFKAFMEHIPRIKSLGVDILWFMPMYPISKKKRKGTLGSYYAVSDYKAVNPEFGTMADFEAMVAAIHAAGMHLILDWVPNHTGWDHHWITEHPEWYTQDAEGNIIDPIDPGTGKSWGWTDVADLNYDNAEMRKEMISDMIFWIKEKNIDGFRMDVAHNVPDDFWLECRNALFAERRPLFMLAESEIESHRNNRYFHATYGWKMHHLLNEIAQGKKSPAEIDKLLIEDRKNFRKGFHIHFTSNHDENTWNGTVMERMGDAHLAFSALAMTMDGMPLLYGGQEEPLEHRLAFFEKDNIDFGEYRYKNFYTRLMLEKHSNIAMWNGKYGGKAEKILINDDDIYGFIRKREGQKLIALFNLTDKQKTFDMPVGIKGTNILTDEKIKWYGNKEMSLEPWEFYLVRND